jgi:hypothetical protein
MVVASSEQFKEDARFSIPWIWNQWILVKCVVLVNRTGLAADGWTMIIASINANYKTNELDLIFERLTVIMMEIIWEAIWARRVR